MLLLYGAIRSGTNIKTINVNYVSLPQQYKKNHVNYMHEGNSLIDLQQRVPEIQKGLAPQVMGVS